MTACDILMYHMVSDPQTEQDARYAIPPRRLEKHLRGLRERGHQFVSLDAVSDWIDGKSALPERAVAVTLDDGYLDNYRNAFPIFERMQVPAAIFLVSGLMGDSNRWMQGRGFSRRELMNWEQARELSRHGITLGGHTHSHVKLPQIPLAEARDELVRCKKSLEDELGIAAPHFAYPYGLLNDEVRELVAQAGYRSACSTRPGANRSGVDRFLLRRIEVCGTDTLAQLRRKMRFGTNDSGLNVPLRYYWQRLHSRLPF